MASEEFKGWSLLLMRLSLVFVFLWHGVPKAMDWAMAMSKFGAMGFPEILGPIVGVVEVVAAILVLVGFWHKWANYVLAAIIVVAIFGVQIAKGVTAGLERDLLIVAGCIILAAHGPGKLALKND